MKLNEITSNITINRSHIFHESRINGLSGIALYPGRFQPFHKGHASIYNKIKRQYENSFIVTSNKTDDIKSPFSFQEKKKIITTMTNIPGSSVIQVKNPYQSAEVLKNFDPEKHFVVYFISQKDMEENPRFNLPFSGIAKKKDGSPAYLQRYNSNPKPFSQHAYIAVAPTVQFNVLGSSVNSSTEIRKLLSDENENKAKKAFVNLYGKYNSSVFNMMRNKLISIDEDADNKEAEEYRKGTIAGKFIYSGWG